MVSPLFGWLDCGVETDMRHHPDPFRPHVAWWLLTAGLVALMGLLGWLLPL
jgi:hypothetical protein